MDNTTQRQQEPPQDGSSLSSLHPYLRFLLTLILFFAAVAAGTTLGIDSALAKYGLDSTGLW
ncbi:MULTISPECIES: hypothetical protein [Vibrio]|uniref:Uncharacterized protein n=1 Tax=Vibrio mediterranei TaxID=689 RepID=A0AAN1FMK8_9VIBR|nr:MULTISPECIES: hypothetical protein [Vibrio]ASI93422.1 hypothetical protein BSZ05_26595 [Vibrio mediterranei]KFA94978.1 hypothetical protein HW45_28375 [Vibrio sp. ER1A]